MKNFFKNNSHRYLKRTIKQVMANNNDEMGQTLQQDLVQSTEKLARNEVNQAFSIIQKELEKIGWMNIEHFFTTFHVPNGISFVDSAAVKLVNKKFNVTILPHETGIEISRLRVWEQYQGKGFVKLFLDNLLRFLVVHGIKDVYVMPSYDELDEPNGIIPEDYSPEGIYEERGFKKLNNSYYWKLTSNENIDVTKLQMDVLKS